MKTNIFKVLKKRPNTFRKLTGLTVEKFEELLKTITPLYNKSEEKRLYKSNRQRAQGAGRRQNLSLEDKLLMLFMYYRVYITHEFLGFIFNLHNSNVSRQINYLQPLLPKIFRIPTRKIKLSEADITEEQLIEILVDATEQQIQRPQRKQKKYYSGKHKKHTLKNQIVVDSQGKILSVTQSHPGKTHDKNIYDKTKIYTDKKSKQIADLGYFGINSMELPFKKPKGKNLTEQQKQFNKILARHRVIVEHCIGKMKIFQILAQRYRNPLHKHSIIFKNIAGIHNMMFV